MEETILNHQYLAGLFDGDGTIGIDINGTGFCLSVSYSQSEKEILDLIQKEFEGKLYSYKRRQESRQNQRTEYKYRICGKESETLMLILKKHTILKYKQLRVGIKYLPLINKKNVYEEKKKLSDKMRKLKGKIECQTKIHRLTVDYVAGLFDAEGSVGLYGKDYSHLRVKLTQASCMDILSEIKDIWDRQREK